MIAVFLKSTRQIKYVIGFVVLVLCLCLAYMYFISIPDTSSILNGTVIHSSIVPGTDLSKGKFKKEQWWLPVTLNTGYIIENKSLCLSAEVLSLVVTVHTATWNFDKRAVMRQTWMNPKYIHEPQTTRLMFLLGTTSDVVVQNKIEEESRIHGDMLQGDFVDVYKNLTHKAVMSLRWLSEHCRNAKFIMKVDDDVIVNMFHIQHYIIPYFNDKPRTVVCYDVDDRAIERAKTSPWYVPPEYFPGKNIYPPFCLGFFSLFTNDMTPLMYRAVKSTPFFYLDDVYVYGLLANRVPGINRRGLKFYSHGLGSDMGPRKPLLPCVSPGSQATSHCDYIVAMGNMSKEQLMTLWKFILQKFFNTISDMIHL